tara:strand:+ start:402 stop:926 length:525 start_codon:yes stop_codon:yes gene_type:complete
MTAFDVAWAVLKGENIHPSVRLHAEMGAKNLDMYPPKTKKINGELEPRSDYTRRRMDYEYRRREAQERAKDNQRVPTTTFGRSVVERMPRDDVADIMDRYARAYEQYSYHSNTPEHKYKPMTRGEYGFTLPREYAVEYHGNKVQEIEDEYAAQGGNPEDFNDLAFEISSKHRGL